MTLSFFVLPTRCVAQIHFPDAHFTTHRVLHLLLFSEKTTTKSAHVPVAYKIYFTAYLSVNIQNLLSLHTCLSKESIFYLLIIISFVLHCRCYGLPQYEHMVLIFMQAEKELNP